MRSTFKLNYLSTIKILWGLTKIVRPKCIIYMNFQKTGRTVETVSTKALRRGQETGFLRVFGLADEKYREKPGF